ncbi:uncharacterized protein LOC111592517 isoform X3 [Drosophila hydei]|uniref:Uncharacterized protein LOC111592517 isoform X3 n=1 Tax=Drosophila hydei TaxID=7224 RepID=A0A6J1L8J9_DROHY|nr:uncharacterized protein LOC111592517 isoform X3 [Drosophila hydei]
MWSKAHKYNKLSPVTPEVVEIYRNPEFEADSDRHIQADLYLPGLRERCDTSTNQDLFNLSTLLTDIETECKAYMDGNVVNVNRRDGDAAGMGDSKAKSNGPNPRNGYQWTRPALVPKKHDKKSRVSNPTEAAVGGTANELFKLQKDDKILQKLPVKTAVKPTAKTVPKPVAQTAVRPVAKTVQPTVDMVAVQPIEKPVETGVQVPAEMPTTIQKRVKKTKKTKSKSKNYCGDSTDATCYETSETTRKVQRRRHNLEKQTVKAPYVEPVQVKVSVTNLKPLSERHTKMLFLNGYKIIQQQLNTLCRICRGINAAIKIVDNWHIYTIFLFLCTIIYLIYLLYQDISEYASIERRYLHKMRTSGIIYKFYYYIMRMMKVPIF